MFEFLNKFFGSKSDRDIKEINPIVENIHSAYEIIKELTNDEIRAKSVGFKEKIKSKN